MPRAFILLMDSFGVGASQDASTYHAEGADTFGHIAENYPLNIPHLSRLGLYHAALASTGKNHPGIQRDLIPQSHFGYAVEQSLGKDTPSGHWEIAGLPVMFEWGYFPKEANCFPVELIEAFIQEAGLPGVLGEKHASGTDILVELGEEHIRTGKPIVYTSADSVFQIAAHEAHFGLEKLYECCEIARRLVDEYNIGRVIARPFSGEVGDFQRTANRRDLSTPPHAPILLDFLKKAGHEVVSIGKVSDIYATQGITQTIKADGNMALFDRTIEFAQTAPDNSLVFTNFVDFDSKYGHRRDVEGYAKAIEAFDARLPEFESHMKPGDIAIITADHGCDPTFPGSDHTREHIPVLMFGPGIDSKFIGRRETFADIGQTIARHLGIDPLDHGIAFN